MINLVSGKLKNFWLIAILIACIAIELSCEKREVAEVTQKSEINQIDLDEYRWKNRLVLIFAQSSKDSFYQKQKSVFESKAEDIDDRDIIIFELLESDISKIAEVPLAYEQQSLLRKKFSVVDDFVFILIGKDGTVKLRAMQPVQSDELFSLIDSMPMRKEEMRRKASQP